MIQFRYTCVNHDTTPLLVVTTSRIHMLRKQVKSLGEHQVILMANFGYVQYIVDLMCKISICTLTYTLTMLNVYFKCFAWLHIMFRLQKQSYYCKYDETGDYT